MHHPVRAARDTVGLRRWVSAWDWMVSDLFPSVGLEYKIDRVASHGACFHSLGMPLVLSFSSDPP